MDNFLLPSFASIVVVRLQAVVMRILLITAHPLLISSFLRSPPPSGYRHCSPSLKKDGQLTAGCEGRLCEKLPYSWRILSFTATFLTAARGQLPEASYTSNHYRPGPGFFFGEHNMTSQEQHDRN